LSADALTELEQHAIHVIREAHARLKPLAMLWSLGKDSNTLIWLTRKAFLGRVPFRARCIPARARPADHAGYDARAFAHAAARVPGRRRTRTGPT
jgi:hypothetical protein